MLKQSAAPTFPKLATNGTYVTSGPGAHLYGMPGRTQGPQPPDDGNLMASRWATPSTTSSQPGLPQPTQSRRTDRVEYHSLASRQASDPVISPTKYKLSASSEAKPASKAKDPLQTLSGAQTRPSAPEPHPTSSERPKFTISAGPSLAPRPNAASSNNHIGANSRSSTLPIDSLKYGAHGEDKDMLFSKEQQKPMPVQTGTQQTRGQAAMRERRLSEASQKGSTGAVDFAAASLKRAGLIVRDPSVHQHDATGTGQSANIASWQSVRQAQQRTENTRPQQNQNAKENTRPQQSHYGTQTARPQQTQLRNDNTRPQQTQYTAGQKAQARPVTNENNRNGKIPTGPRILNNQHEQSSRRGYAPTAATANVRGESASGWQNKWISETFVPLSAVLVSRNVEQNSSNAPNAPFNSFAANTSNASHRTAPVGRFVNPLGPTSSPPALSQKVVKSGRQQFESAGTATLASGKAQTQAASLVEESRSVGGPSTAVTPTSVFRADNKSDATGKASKSTVSCWAECGARFESYESFLKHLEAPRPPPTLSQTQTPVQPSSAASSITTTTAPKSDHCRNAPPVAELYRTVSAPEFGHRFICGRYLQDIDLGRDLIFKYDANAWPFYCPRFPCDDVFQTLSALVGHVETGICPGIEEADLKTIPDKGPVVVQWETEAGAEAAPGASTQSMAMANTTATANANPSANATSSTSEATDAVTAIENVAKQAKRGTGEEEIHKGVLGAMLEALRYRLSNGLM